MADGSQFQSFEGSNSFGINLSAPQFELVTSKAKFPAFVGGFGSGKTHALINRALMFKSMYPEGNIGYYLPTFDLVSMIALPRFEETLEELKVFHPSIAFKVVKSPRPYIAIENCGQIIFRTMDNPSRIVGYETTDSFIDEIDILKEEEAKHAWRKILARNRQKKPDRKKNTIAVGTTPEGFKFVYQQWAKEPEKTRPKGYELIRASTYSNQHNLPYDYIDDLYENYPSNLISAYIEGEFVNLTAGSVYPEFDRKKHFSKETIISGPDVYEDLHIGMDFNVTKMAAVIFVRRNNFPHAVLELTGLFDTPAMIAAIKRRFPKHRIFVYPDASGSNRKSNNASESDIALLEGAGFYVFKNNANPAVKDRVLSINVLLHKNQMFVNLEGCPVFTEGLEKQAYDKNGEPDKTSGLDHALDAAGYLVAYLWPVRSRSAQHIRLAGV